MNIKNIVSLSEMLTGIGFSDDIAKRLVKHICFKPVAFQLTERFVKDNSWLTSAIFLGREVDHYECLYHDVSLLKAIEIPDLTIQSINVRELDQRMAGIDWSFVGTEGLTFDTNDELSWQNEQKIEDTVTDIAKLSGSSNEGKHFADYLKLKHWSGIEQLNGQYNLNSIRSKFEVSQRFYFFDGKGISIEEAYRFLLNRWIEKKMNARARKNIEASDNSEESSDAGNDKSLLQKKQKRKSHRLKQ